MAPSSESVNIRTRIFVDPNAAEPGIRAMTAQVRQLTDQVESLGTGVSQAMTANMRSMSREVRTLRRQMGIGARAFAEEQRKFARQVEADMRAVNARVEAMGQRIESRGAQISRLLTFGAGVIALERMVRLSTRLASNMLSLQTSMQNAEMSIAGIFAAMGSTTVPQTLGMAREVIQGLRADAAAGAGELQDYVDAYQRLLSPVNALGGSLEDVREITRLALGAGFALRGQEGMQLAAMDILQGLQGGMSAKESQILAPLLSVAGYSLEQLNAAQGAEKMEMIVDSLRQMAPAVDAMGDTWEAQMAQLQDQVRDLMRTASAPIFARWTQHLRNANDWLERNRDMLQEMAEVWGRRLLETWDSLIERSDDLGRALAVAGVVGATAQAGSSTGLWARMFDAGGGAATGAAARRGVGGMAARVAVSSTASGLGGMALVLGGVATSAASVNAALQAQPGHWIILERRLEGITEAGRRFKEDVLDAWAHLFEEGGMGARFGDVLLRGAEAALWFVEKLIVAADWIFWGLGKISEWFTDVGPTIGAALGGTIIDGLNPFLGMGRERLPGETSIDQLQRIRRERMADRWGGVGSRVKDYFGFGVDPENLGMSMYDPELDDPFGTSAYDPVLDRRDPPKAPQTNIGHVTVNINVRDAQDPQRVAQSMDTVLNYIEQYRTQARRPLKPR